MRGRPTDCILHVKMIDNFDSASHLWIFEFCLPRAGLIHETATGAVDEILKLVLDLAFIS